MLRSKIMKKVIKNTVLLVCAGVIVVLIPILFANDTPIEVNVPHLNLQELEEKERQLQAEKQRELQEQRKDRITRCVRNDDCIIVDKDPCGCLIGPKGVTAINALYTIDFNMLQGKAVTKTCPEKAPRAVRECSPSARAVCSKKRCKIVY